MSLFEYAFGGELSKVQVDRFRSRNVVRVVCPFLCVHNELLCEFDSGQSYKLYVVMNNIITS